MSATPEIPFNIPYVTGAELGAVGDAITRRTLHGDGYFTKRCQKHFVGTLSADSAFLTGSCSLAMDMATLVANIRAGDEVLVPNFTFVSTAQSVALRGAVPVFCDIRPDTLNLDEGRLEEALTEKTKAILPIHYAGISAEMTAICQFAEKHGLMVIEDAAQAIGCKYEEKPVGTYGDMSAFSFHATKNIQCGEGGMLVVNNPAYTDACAIAWEKGTDRREFLSGNVQKYQWQSLGNSFLASELTAAFLHAQLESELEINKSRTAIWQRYQDAFLPLSGKHGFQCPFVPDNVTHNGHLYYLVLPDSHVRTAFISHMAEQGIQIVFHYTPLQESTGGRVYGRVGTDLNVSSDIPHRLVRLPLYPDLLPDMQDRVINSTIRFLERL